MNCIQNYINSDQEVVGIGGSRVFRGSKGQEVKGV